MKNSTKLKLKGYGKSFLSGFGLVSGTYANILWAAIALASDQSKADKIANLLIAAAAEVLTVTGGTAIYQSGLKDVTEAVYEEFNEDSD